MPMRSNSRWRMKASKSGPKAPIARASARLTMLVVPLE